MLTLDMLQDINSPKMKDVFGEEEIVVLEILDGFQVDLNNKNFEAFVGEDSTLVNFSKNLWNFLKDRIPANITVEGSDLLYKRQILYTQMPSAFAIYAAILNNNWIMSWDDTVRLAQILDLRCAPVLYRGKYTEELHKKSYSGVSMWRSLPFDDNEISTSSPQMGYMVRPVSSFSINDINEKYFIYRNPTFLNTDFSEFELRKNNILVVTNQVYTHYKMSKSS